MPTNDKKPMLKIKAVKSKKSVNDKVNETLVKMVEEIGVINVSIGSDTDTSTWNKKFKKSVEESFWNN